MDLYLKHHSGAGQLRGVVLREGDIDVLLVAGLHADDLLLKTGNKGAGTQLQAVVLAFAALERLAVFESLKVNDRGIALLGLALHADQPGGPVNVRLQLSLDVGGRHLHLGFGDLQALVVLDGRLGLDGDDGLEAEAAGAGLQHLQLGIGHRLDAGFLQRRLISIRIGHGDGVVEEDLGAVHLLHHLSGGLAFAEAGDIDAVFLPCVHLINGGLELVGSYLNDQLIGAVFFFFVTFDVHGVFLQARPCLYRGPSF